MRLRIEELRIFALYKDRPHKGVRNITNMVKKEQGFEPSGDFCREIINYQIKKYGEPLNGSKSTYLSDFSGVSSRMKRKKIENSAIAYNLNKFIERNTKRGKKDL
jgi:hypothetical protein